MLQTAPLPTAPRVREALDEVFRRPEFAPETRSPLGEALRAAWRWLERAIEFLVPDVSAGEAGGDLLYWIVIGGMVLVGVGVALHLAGALPRLWRLRDRGGGEEGGRGPGGRPSRAAEWEARARRAAAAGRWREAALALYQALLLRLDEKGAVRYDPSKTPGDYRREARRAGAEHRQALDGFLRRFEPVAFGGRALDSEGYEGLRTTAGKAGARG